MYVCMYVFKPQGLTQFVLSLRSLSEVGKVKCSTLLIPLVLGFLIRVGDLPHLPSMDCEEVLKGILVSIFLGKKIYVLY